jgi:hypothetical protein
MAHKSRHDGVRGRYDVIWKFEFCSAVKSQPEKRYFTAETAEFAEVNFEIEFFRLGALRASAV